MDHPVPKLEDWPQNVLMARARVLCLRLEPNGSVWLSRRNRQLTWQELYRILRELDRRGLQGKLL